MGTNEHNVLHPHILSRKVQHFQPSSQLSVSGWATFVVFKDLGNCCPEIRSCLPALRENKRDHPLETPGCSHVWTGSEGFQFLPTVLKNSDGKIISRPKCVAVKLITKKHISEICFGLTYQYTVPPAVMDFFLVTPSLLLIISCHAISA